MSKIDELKKENELLAKIIEKNRHKIEIKTAMKKIKLANEVIESCWSMFDFNKKTDPKPIEKPYKIIEYFKGGLDLVDMYNSLENIKKSGNIDGLIIEDATLVRKAGECSRYELTVTYLKRP